ncbi:hypothetical protein KR009_003295 [Drosophila setifemur]|nr:hypothetical protein KR009_003295 [Drosophila setifemur]
MELHSKKVKLIEEMDEDEKLVGALRKSQRVPPKPPGRRTNRKQKNMEVDKEDDDEDDVLLRAPAESKYESENFTMPPSNPPDGQMEGDDEFQRVLEEIKKEFKLLNPTVAPSNPPYPVDLADRDCDSPPSAPIHMVVQATVHHPLDWSPDASRN